MYYVYIIGIIIITLLLIGAIQAVALFLIKEFDKFIYVKNYKQELKRYQKPVYYLYVILTYLALLIVPLISLLIFFFGDEIYKKQYKIGFSTIFITPTVGIGLTAAGFRVISDLLYKFEFSFILESFTLLMYFAMILSVMYYTVLGFKQAINMYRIESIQLEKYCGYKIINKKMVLNDVLSSAKSSEYLDNYLQLYETELEWKESDFVSINYKYYVNLFAIIFTGGILLNLMLDAVINEFIFVNTVNLQGMFFTIILLVIVFANWLINRDVILVFKKNSNITKLMTIIFIVSGAIALLSSPIILEQVFDGEIIGEELGYDYQKNKEDTVRSIQNRNDYLNYTYLEKINYIIDYPDYFIDDLNALNYLYDEVDFKVNHEFYSFYAPIENEVVIDGSKRYHENETEFYMCITRSYDEKSYNIYLSPTPVEVHGDLESESFYHIKQNDVEKNYVVTRTDGEQEFRDSMVQESERIIDRLWTEEMKDRGLA